MPYKIRPKADMWNHWQIRVCTSLIAGLLLPLGWLLMGLAALTGWMGATLPWWAYIMAAMGLGLLILSPALIPVSLNKKLGCGFSVLLGLLSLGVIAVAVSVGDTVELNVPLPICSTCQDTRQVAFPILVITAFLVVSSGCVRDWRTIVALISSLVVALAISLISERATQGIQIDHHQLSLPFVLFLLPSLAFSLSTLWNLGIREKLRPHVIVLSSAVVIAIALVLSLGLGRVFTL